MNILIDAPLPDEAAAKLRSLSRRVRLLRGLTPANLRLAEVIYTEAADFDPSSAPALTFVQTNTSATNPQRRSAVFRTSVPLCNAAGAYSPAVAQFALGLLLGGVRKLSLSHGFKASRTWPQDETPWCGDELRGAVVGVVGYGSIGREFARLANALGMTTVAYKRDPAARRHAGFRFAGTGDPQGKLPTRWFGPGELHRMLALCDHAVVTMPDVPGTERIVGRRELAALKPHAQFVNVGRGSVVDEAALVDCLQRGSLAGAALDVFSEEPLPSDHPLWTAPNLVMMPHVASWCRQQSALAAEVLVENVARRLARRRLLNVVDKERLY
jgi:phosphoglycerate dehydrogenase-like enzyme